MEETYAMREAYPNEKSYIGTKIILGCPMDEREFAKSQLKDWDESKPSRLGYRVQYEDGYVSWSPKDVFERSYRPITKEEKRLVF